jgi:hypothetical protein
MMARSTLRCLLLASALFWPVVAATAANSSTLPTEYDWLLKDVCADATNTPVAADPYYGCPAVSGDR